MPHAPPSSPLLSPPFAMPVSLLTATLRLARPWTLPASTAASPTTSLRGALGETLARSDAFAPLAARFKLPPTRLYANQLPPCLLVHASASVDPCAFALRALLRGPETAPRTTLLRDALDRTGELGLLHGGESIPFVVDEAAVTEGSAADLLRDRLPPVAPSRVLVEFLTPCNAPSFDPDELAGNLACGLVKLDRALSDDGNLSKRAVDDEADAARDAARVAFAEVRVPHRALVDVPRGARYSGGSGHSFPLGGAHGAMTLEGDLTDALPWLLLMELHGVGGNTAFGMGRLRLWGA